MIVTFKMVTQEETIKCLKEAAITYYSALPPFWRNLTIPRYYAHLYDIQNTNELPIKLNILKEIGALDIRKSDSLRTIILRLI